MGRFTDLSLRGKVWTKTDNKRTKAYKLMICRLFCLWFDEHLFRVYQSERFQDRLIQQLMKQQEIGS
jgi:hypothetical protein